MSDNTPLLRAKCILLGYTIHRSSGEAGRWYIHNSKGHDALYEVKNDFYGRETEREVLEDFLRSRELL